MKKAYQILSGITLRLLLYFPLYILHLFAFIIAKEKTKISEDLHNYKAWPELIDNSNLYLSLARVLVFDRAFRNVFYMRIGGFSKCLKIFLPPLNNVLLCHSDNIAGGFNLIHGYNVVFNSNVIIGRNCVVLHGVTIGEDWKGGVPTIGDDVFVGCNAIIIGNVHIGNRVKIGAGAIVVEDIPDDATVVGYKGRVISKKNGHKELS